MMEVEIMHQLSRFESDLQHNVIGQTKVRRLNVLLTGKSNKLNSVVINSYVVFLLNLILN